MNDMNEQPTGYGQGKRYNAIAMNTTCDECGHNAHLSVFIDCDCCADAREHQQRMIDEDDAQMRSGSWLIGFGHARDSATGRIEHPSDGERR
jgi:hypothetical protein